MRHKAGEETVNEAIRYVRAVSEAIFGCVSIAIVFLQLLYILGVYWAGPNIASAFQVHTSYVTPALVM